MIARTQPQSPVWKYHSLTKHPTKHSLHKALEQYNSCYIGQNIAVEKGLCLYRRFMKCEPGSRDSVISIGFKANQMLKRCCLDDCVINQKYSAQITGYSLECVLTHVSFAIAVQCWMTPNSNAMQQHLSMVTFGIWTNDQCCYFSGEDSRCNIPILLFYWMALTQTITFHQEMAMLFIFFSIK